MSSPRLATSKDIATIADFQVAMALETEGLALDPARVHAGVDRVLTTNPTEKIPRAEYWVIDASAGDGLAACHLILYEWSDWRNGWVLWMHSLYVRPEFRRQGLLRRLYEFQQARIRETADFHGLRLYVDRRNTRAIRAYEDLGMTTDHYACGEWMKSEGSE